MDELQEELDELQEELLELQNFIWLSDADLEDIRAAKKEEDDLIGYEMEEELQRNEENNY